MENMATATAPNTTTPDVLMNLRIMPLSFTRDLQIVQEQIHGKYVATKNLYDEKKKLDIIGKINRKAIYGQWE